MDKFDKHNKETFSNFNLAQNIIEGGLTNYTNRNYISGNKQVLKKEDSGDSLMTFNLPNIPSYHSTLFNGTENMPIKNLNISNVNPFITGEELINSFDYGSHINNMCPINLEYVS